MKTSHFKSSILTVTTVSDAVEMLKNRVESEKLFSLWLSLWNVSHPCCHETTDTEAPVISSYCSCSSRCHPENPRVIVFILFYYLDFLASFSSTLMELYQKVGWNALFCHLLCWRQDLNLLRVIIYYIIICYLHKHWFCSASAINSSLYSFICNSHW